MANLLLNIPASIDLSFAGTNSYLRGRAELTLLSQSATNLTSTISVKLYLYKASGFDSTTTAVFRGSVSVAGVSTSYTSSSLTLGSSEQQVYSGTHTYTHNSNGTGSFTFSASCRYGERTETTDSDTVTVPTISVASTLYVSPSGAITIGATNVSLTISTPDNSWYHIIRVRNSSGAQQTITILQSGTTSYNFVPSTTIGSLLTSSTSATLYIDCIAYSSGGTQLGTSTVTRVFVTSNSQGPTVGVPTISAVNQGGTTVPYGFVAGVTYLKLVWSVSGNSGSSISSASTTIDGVQYAATIVSGTATVLTSKPVGTSGDKTITVNATDSRGYTNTASKIIAVTPYNTPRINTLSVTRSDQYGTVATNGTYALVDYAYEVIQLSTYNKYSFLLEYRKKTTTAWSTASSLTDQSSNFSKTSFLVVNLGDSESEYEFRLTVSDTLSGDDSRAISTKTLGTESVLINLISNGTGLSFGKLAELAGVFDIGYMTRFYGGILGTIIPSGSNIASYTIPGFYYGTTTNVISGVPSTIGGYFGLLIVPTGESTVAQVLFEQVANTAIIPNPLVRSYTGSQWTNWYKLSMTVVS